MLQKNIFFGFSGCPGSSQGARPCWNQQQVCVQGNTRVPVGDCTHPHRHLPSLLSLSRLCQPSDTGKPCHPAKLGKAPGSHAAPRAGEWPSGRVSTQGQLIPKLGRAGDFTHPPRPRQNQHWCQGLCQAGRGQGKGGGATACAVGCCPPTPWVPCMAVFMALGTWGPWLGISTAQLGTGRICMGRAGCRHECPGLRLHIGNTGIAAYRGVCVRACVCIHLYVCARTCVPSRGWAGGVGLVHLAAAFTALRVHACAPVGLNTCAGRAPATLTAPRALRVRAWVSAEARTVSCCLRAARPAQPGWGVPSQGRVPSAPRRPGGEPRELLRHTGLRGHPRG